VQHAAAHVVLAGGLELEGHVNRGAALRASVGVWQCVRVCVRGCARTRVSVSVSVSVSARACLWVGGRAGGWGPREGAGPRVPAALLPAASP
jgi:hypothetical protein